MNNLKKSKYEYPNGYSNEIHKGYPSGLSIINILMNEIGSKRNNIT